MNYLKKFLSAFCYGSGFVLSIICAFFAVNQLTSPEDYDSNSSYKNVDPEKEIKSLNSIEVINTSKLSNFTNYTNVGRREEFIFTGELKNNSGENSFEKILVEVDLYDKEGKFIFKCGGWNGEGIKIKPNETVTFQKFCHSMPPEIATNYGSFKTKITQRRH